MLFLSKEEADNLSEIVGQGTDYVLDAYVGAVKYGGSLTEFHSILDADEEELVINLLSGNAVIEHKPVTYIRNVHLKLLKKLINRVK